jgi:predicted transcriptional regulator
MKIAISLPDDLFRAIDRCARRLRVPRSRLLADGARLIVDKYGESDATAAWNDAIDAAGQPGDEPHAAALRGRSKRAVRRATRSW